MSHWVRLWDDMPTDPKWRVIARRSGRPLPEVLSVFVFMMANAGANATERGELSNWSDEDVGAALDIDGEHVAAIREAMQGKTLDGDKLSGWERRQPKREDNSSDRAKAWREEQKRMRMENEERERNRTQPNAEKRPDADADADADAEKGVHRDSEKSDRLVGVQGEGSPPESPAPTAPRKAKRAKSRSQIDADAQIDDAGVGDAVTLGLTPEQARREWAKFVDYHRSRASVMADWSAAWRTWCRNAVEFMARSRSPPQVAPQRSKAFETSIPASKF
ncbi:MAG TPA: hypothetical protein VIG36_11250 [Methylocystis sp.]